MDRVIDFPEPATAGPSAPIDPLEYGLNIQYSDAHKAAVTRFSEAAAGIIGGRGSPDLAVMIAIFPGPT